ncbi:hypothetical protein ACJMK2_001860 [Sinanodonta woodiana]|uniref:C-type lectin domain-containing protein n=1 Tax=Sinanodonta woodiana TaxID=1069815 RepID=A0ABD3XWN5_SINWO
MKAEFYCISFLLLKGYAYSCDRSERETLLGKLSYGKILPLSAFTTRYQVNLYQCATECWLRKQRCKSFNYRRIYPSCQLCEEESEDGIDLHAEDDSIHSNIVTWKNFTMGNCSALSCTWTERCDPFYPSGSACVPSECPLMETMPGVTIDPSNETSLGTHVWQIYELQSMNIAYHMATSSYDIDDRNVSFGDKSFFIKFHNRKRTFNEAVQICRSENAKLLLVTTKQQIDVIKEAFSHKNRCVFAGISVQAQNNTWFSWDGTNVAEIDWSPGKPTAKSTEKCGVINFNTYVTGLEDVSCNEKCSFLCH